MTEPLPNVEPTEFEIVGNQLYYVPTDEKKIRVARFGLCANGVRDLCIIYEDSDYKIAKLAETTEDKIILIPKGDIACFVLEKPYHGKCTIIMDVESDLRTRDLIKAILKMQHGEKGEDFDMYAGGRYTVDERR